MSFYGLINIWLQINSRETCNTRAFPIGNISYYNTNHHGRTHAFGSKMYCDSDLRIRVYVFSKESPIFIPKSYVRPNLKPSYSRFISKNLYRLGVTQPKVGKILRFLDFIWCFTWKLNQTRFYEWCSYTKVQYTIVS